MWANLFGWMWRRTPGRVRRWGVRLVEPRFMITAGAIVLDERGRVLLLKHRFRVGSGWGIPGGFLEKGEQPEDGLRRELCEEIGLELGVVELLFARTLRRPQQLELHYRCRARAVKEVRPRSQEIISAGWFAPDQLPPELSSDQRRLIERAIKTDANLPD